MADGSPESSVRRARDQHPLIANLQRRRERHLQRARWQRVLVVLVGATVTLGGLALLVLPGPAFVLIPIGLALLALEFAWAERMLEHAIDRAEAARVKAVEASRIQKVLSVTATVLAVAAFVAAAILWDIPLLPV